MKTPEAFRTFIAFYLRACVKALCFDADNSTYHPDTHGVTWAEGAYNCLTRKRTGFRVVQYSEAEVQLAFEQTLDIFQWILPRPTQWREGTAMVQYLLNKPYLPISLLGMFLQLTLSDQPDGQSRNSFLYQVLDRSPLSLLDYLSEELKALGGRYLRRKGRLPGLSEDLEAEIEASANLDELFYQAGEAGRKDLFLRLMKDQDLQCGLDGAVAGGQEPLMDLALEQGASITAHTIDLAIQFGRIELLPILIKGKSLPSYLLSSIEAQQPIIAEWLLEQIEQPSQDLLISAHLKAEQHKLTSLAQQLQHLLSR